MLVNDFLEKTNVTIFWKRNLTLTVTYFGLLIKDLCIINRVDAIPTLPHKNWASVKYMVSPTIKTKKQTLLEQKSKTTQT